MVLWLTFFVPCVLALLSLLAVRSLMARGVARWWWTAFFVCIVVGIGSGVWFTFFKEEASSGLRCIGYPLPWDTLVKPPNGSKGEWTEWKRMEYMAVLDMLLFSSISVYPVWIANTLWRFARGGESCESGKESHGRRKRGH